MVKEVVEYLKNSEELKDKEIIIDYMPSQTGTFCLKAKKFEPVAEKYVDGGELRRYECTFCMREAYTFDNLQNGENCRILEALCECIEKWEKEGFYPQGQNFVKVEVTSGIYIISNDVSTAEYALDIRFLYMK